MFKSNIYICNKSSTQSYLCDIKILLAAMSRRNLGRARRKPALIYNSTGY